MVAAGGSNNLATSGGEAVQLFGQRFGAASEFVEEPHVTYGPASNRYMYKAINCSIAVDNEIISCLSVEGVGRHHVWSLISNNFTVTAIDCCDQPDCTTCTSYSPPTIYQFLGAGAMPTLQEDAMADEMGITSKLANTNGGENVWIIGDNFGTVGNTHIDSVVYTSVVSNRTYTALGCHVVVAHERIRCNTSSGSGGKLDWVLQIGGQPSRTPSTGYGKISFFVAALFFSSSWFFANRTLSLFVSELPFSFACDYQHHSHKCFVVNEHDGWKNSGIDGSKFWG